MIPADKIKLVKRLVAKQLSLCQLGHWQPHVFESLQRRIAINSNNWQYYIDLINSVPEYHHLELSVNNGIVTLGTGKQNVGITNLAEQLCPWRKGPFSIFDTHIDSEWRCQLKWDRLVPLIEVSGNRILDAGSGNGYFAWRLLDSGAQSVVLVDPLPLYWAQFQLVWLLAQLKPITYIATPIETLPKEQCFDLILCMGVLYHSPSPFALLRNLKKMLLPEGILIVETLIVDGNTETVFVPPKRYAGMKNVWAIPSIAATSRWLQRCGFEIVAIGKTIDTSVKEQRVTKWSNATSLANFINHDSSATIEGHPPPKRVIIKARKLN